MTRVGKHLPHQLSAAQRALYESITTGPRASGKQSFSLTDGDGALVGPFNAMLLSPGVGHALERLGASLRYDTGLDRRATEVVILTVASSWESAFEQAAHEAVGRDAGLHGDEIAALRQGNFRGRDHKESVVADLARALSGPPHDLDDVTYARAVDALGTAAVFEISTIVGYYSLLALQLRVFRVGVPDVD